MPKIQSSKHLFMNNFTEEYLSVNKIFNHLDRVKELTDTGDTLPIMMEIDPTNSCIHKCPRCPESGNRFAEASLTLDFMKKAIDQTSPFLKAAVFTGGGEPLYNPNTIEAIKYAASKGLSVALITNGTLINEEKSEAIVRYCEWVRISIDAFDEKDYLQTHGIGEEYLQKVWHNIGLLVEAKKKFNTKCTIGVAYLVSKQNRKNMFKFAEKAKKVMWIIANSGHSTIQILILPAICQRPKNWKTKISKSLPLCRELLRKKGILMRVSAIILEQFWRPTAISIPAVSLAGTKSFVWAIWRRTIF